MLTEIDNVVFMLEHFESVYYYGPVMEVVLPTYYPAGVSKCKILTDNEQYAPVPYVVAIYKLVLNTGGSFGYRFVGVEIRNND